jgi:S-adenosylmethionine-diacylgycerolhomoserine-N-methlytransferase
MNASELRTVWNLLRGMPAAGAAAERLERFYRPQAATYDRFRSRLLAGRAELLDHLDLAPGARVIELGAGTGYNVELWGPRIRELGMLELVDLCPALLHEARLRCRSFPNVRVIEADATSYRPSEPVDCVYFSYALTMIPDWFRALTNALAILKTGGVIGIVDFYVSAPEAPDGFVQHEALTRWLLPRWFRHDGVLLNPSHLDALHSLTARLHLREDSTRLPYLAGVRAPYYVYVGMKTTAHRAEAVQHLWKKAAEG